MCHIKMEDGSYVCTKNTQALCLEKIFDKPLENTRSQDATVSESNFNTS
jgi:hypothetical protein